MDRISLVPNYTMCVHILHGSWPVTIYFSNLYIYLEPEPQGRRSELPSVDFGGSCDPDPNLNGRGRPSGVHTIGVKDAGVMEWAVR